MPLIPTKFPSVHVLKLHLQSPISADFYPNMVEWSNLPTDLLHLISKRLDSHFDLLRFRSVCSSWRSSTPSKPRLISSHLPILPTTGITEITWAFYLTKRSILRVGLPDPPSQTTPNSWLIKIEEDPSGLIRLINPLTTFKFRDLPPDFPKTFDFSGLRVFELGQEYVLEYMDYNPPGNVDVGSLYMEKVAFCSGNGNGDDFWLLTIHLSGKLAMFRRGDKKWTLIDDMQSPYDDVIYFDGKFYAVDNTGRTVVVDVADGSSPVVNLGANSVFGGDKKSLVESEGELLLVDTYFSMYLDDDEHVRWMIERMIHFKVFRLDQRENKWIEVESLGDRLLFLGDDSSFSARACDFHGCKGNSICFTNISFFSDAEDEDASRSGTIGVFDLDSGTMGPLSSYANYSRSIWPPPAWVSSASEGMCRAESVNEVDSESSF